MESIIQLTAIAIPVLMMFTLFAAFHGNAYAGKTQFAKRVKADLMGLNG